MVAQGKGTVGADYGLDVIGGHATSSDPRAGGEQSRLRQDPLPVHRPGVTAPTTPVGSTTPRRSGSTSSWQPQHPIRRRGAAWRGVPERQGRPRRLQGQRLDQPEVVTGALRLAAEGDEGDLRPRLRGVTVRRRELRARLPRLAHPARADGPRGPQRRGQVDAPAAPVRAARTHRWRRRARRADDRPAAGRPAVERVVGGRPLPLSRRPAWGPAPRSGERGAGGPGAGWARRARGHPDATAQRWLAAACPGRPVPARVADRPAARRADRLARRRCGAQHLGAGARAGRGACQSWSPPTRRRPRSSSATRWSRCRPAWSARCSRVSGCAPTWGRASESAESFLLGLIAPEERGA